MSRAVDPTSSDLPGCATTTSPHPVVARTWWAAAVVLAVIGGLGLLLTPGPTAGPGSWAATVSTSGDTADLIMAESGMLARRSDASEHQAALDELIRRLTSFDAAVLADVDAYRTPRRRVALVNLALAVVVPVMTVRRFLSSGSAPTGRVARPAAVARLTGRIVLLTAVAQTPGIAWVRLVHDAAWGFRTRSTVGWALDHLVVVGARAVLLAAAAAGVSAIIIRWPADWPARLTVGATTVVLLGILLHPLLVHPLLLPERPLEAGPHADALAEMAARSPLDVTIVVGEASRRTSRRNALATGLGPTRRIVLHDTLFDLSPQEVAALAAHELAHLEHHDLARSGFALAPVVLALGFGSKRLIGRPGRDVVRAVSPPRGHGPALTMRTAAIMLAGVLVLETLSTPVVALVSRRFERAADARAVILSEDVGTLVMSLRAFTRDDLADPDPPRWVRALTATHPTTAERIGAALALAADAGLPLPEPGALIGAEDARVDRRRSDQDASGPSAPLPSARR